MAIKEVSYCKVGVYRSSTKQFLNMWELNNSYLRNSQILIATDLNTSQLDSDQYRCGHLGHLHTPSKFSKHCIAILTFLQKRSKNDDEILYSNRFKEKS